MHSFWLLLFAIKWYYVRQMIKDYWLGLKTKENKVMFGYKVIFQKLHPPVNRGDRDQTTANTCTIKQRQRKCLKISPHR